VKSDQTIPLNRDSFGSLKSQGWRRLIISSSVPEEPPLAPRLRSNYEYNNKHGILKEKSYKSMMMMMMEDIHSVDGFSFLHSLFSIYYTVLIECEREREKERILLLRSSRGK
jgi:hypothetical protein